MKPIVRAALSGALWASLAVTAAWSPSAHASVSVELSLERLAGAANTIGVFVPLEKRATWEGGRIYTYSRVRLSSRVAGADPGSELWVRTRGGVMGTVGQWVDGEPILTIGEPTLLFLRGNAASAFTVVGAAQGQYRIVSDEHSQKRVQPSPDTGLLLAPARSEGISARQSIAGGLLTDVIGAVSFAWRQTHES